MAAAMTMQANHLLTSDKFTVDSLEYADWKLAFDGLIDSCLYTDLQKLHLLRECVDGDAKQAIRGYFSVQMRIKMHYILSKLSLVRKS